MRRLGFRHPPGSHAALRPLETRRNLGLAVGFALLGLLGYLAARASSMSLPHGFAVVLLATTPVCAAASAFLLLLRARAEHDDAVRWIATGLALAALGLFLHLISFPQVSAGGGVFGTTRQGMAWLYLAWHLVVALTALAGLARLGRRIRYAAFAAGVVGMILLALPQVTGDATLFIRRNGHYTPAYLGAVAGLAALTLVAALLWARGGRSAVPSREWVTIALALAVDELALLALAGHRYSPLWWTSLFARAATYLVLLGGLLWSLSRQLVRLERRVSAATTDGWSGEDAGGGQVRTWVGVAEHLLAGTAGLSAAVTPTDVADVLSRAACQAVGFDFAGVAVVDQDDPDLLHLLAGEHTDPQTQQLLSSYRRDQPLPSAAVVRSLEPLYLQTPEEVADEYGSWIATVPGSPSGSLAALPLVSGGRAVGALVLRGRHPHVFTRLEREVLAALARTGATALQRALLFEQQQTVASVLQRALLPRRLPQTPGLAFAARYVPASAGADVGGDWYDVLPLPGPDGTAGDRVLLVVGDVVGKGVPAAALMGQLSGAVRTLAALDPDPAAILRGLDRQAAGFALDELVTVLVLLWDPLAGQATIANAGHLPPVLVPPAGPARLAAPPPAPPVGAPLATPRQVARLPLPAGSSVLLFTDGLVEDRDRDLDDGLRALSEQAAVLVRDSTLTLDDVAERLVAQRQAQTDRRDDLTLLLARDQRLSWPRMPAQASERPADVPPETAAPTCQPRPV